MNPHTTSLLAESQRDAGGHPDASPIAIWNLMRRKHIIYTARLILSGRVILPGKESLYREVKAWCVSSGHILDIGIKDIPASLLCLGIPTNWMLKDNVLWNPKMVAFVMLGES